MGHKSDLFKYTLDHLVLINVGLGETDGCSDPMAERQYLRAGVPPLGKLLTEERLIC